MSLLKVLGSCWVLRFVLFFWPGIEPRTPALGAWTLSHWTTREVLSVVEEISLMHAVFTPSQSHTNGPWDFPGGTVDRNLPANAGDTGSTPGPGGSHMLWNHWAPEPQLLKPTRSRVHVMQQEMSLQKESCAPQWRVVPILHNEREPAHSNEDPAWPKIK